jgi:hypothetical protein
VAGNFREYTSRSEMERAGWSIASTESTCRNCQASITWAKSPKGKSVPLDSNSTKLHFKSCTGDSSTSPKVVRSQPETVFAGESALLRESLDECAQAVRELCRILRARGEAVRQ